MKNHDKRRKDGPRAISPIEIPQEVVDELIETVVLPRLVEEYLAEEFMESVDTGDTMERDASLGGLA
ncbi:MAG: hypothetical protein ACREUQ_09940 [Burkholderiales bacterium]